MFRGGRETRLFPAKERTLSPEKSRVSFPANIKKLMVWYL
ncbi:Uncharacterized protein dnm_085850 [Desulfonema magnum]|uniref:Uncharacterized protein n=1 Tax=Desulfonema magnum TaxID=45655 RepID=A0A975GSX2_9BACT|nr:Uncharacterized protein dnm_085850 [Desulfonema magnum]